MKILEMLTYCRPAGSVSEMAFLEKFIAPFNPTRRGLNLVVEVPGGTGKTLFSCHTDTVHHRSGIQVVDYHQEMNVACKGAKSTEPLGADNTAGVWLLLEMIQMKIPGFYAFHYGEEKGCLGSKQMAEKFPRWLRQFERAIAFDRRGTTSVITHQMGNRCCSEEFAKAICGQLKDYKLDNGGLYTDTACYTHLIRECTNLSVGYANEHGPDETLDLEHLIWLRDSVKEVDWDNLPVERRCSDKSARESGRSYSTPSYSSGGYTSRGGASHHNNYGWESGKTWDARQGCYVWPGDTDEDDRPGSYSPGKVYVNGKWTMPGQPSKAKRDKSDAQYATMDFFCEAAMSDAFTWKQASELCHGDPEYAALLLYALTCQQHDEPDMRDVPDHVINSSVTAVRKTKRDADKPAPATTAEVQDNIADLCAGVLSDDAVRDIANTVAAKYFNMVNPAAHELWGLALDE